MSHKTPEVTKLVLTITKGRDRYKMKKMYEVQSTDTLKKDADSFIDAVLVVDTDSLNDASISHKVLTRKVYLNDN